jgi:signal transduction histidine kinase
MDLQSSFGRPLRNMDELEHELRTPLASILSIAEILRDHPDIDEAERQRFLDAMHEEGGRLAELVEHLLRTETLDRALFSQSLARDFTPELPAPESHPA